MTSSDPRLDVLKTFKMYVNGAFPRSESGRSEIIRDRAGTVIGHSCKASRKDLRDAVLAARSGLAKWKGSTAYLRGQILYRMAEMLQGKRAEFIALLGEVESSIKPAEEVDAAIDRLVHYAGWTDKYQQVLAGQNPVAGPYWNLSTPEPTGVIGIVCPTDAPLLGLVSLLAPVICSGNTAVGISPAFAPVVSVFGEVCATSDLPAGAVNLLTGTHDELIPILATHRDIDGLHAAGISEAHATTLRQGVAENMKRVTITDASHWTSKEQWETVCRIEPFVEIKTVWHPVGA